MSDNLVKRLRDLGDRAEYMPHMHRVAADRLQELEAKLATAVEALSYYANSETVLLYDDAFVARTTLAELKGKK